MLRLKIKLWNFLSSIIPNYYRRVLKMDIGANVKIARTALLDNKVNPRGIHIGDNTWILRDAIILAHDHCRGENGKGKLFDTYIGKKCVVGVRSIVLPGVKIGESCVVAAGAVVTKNVPPNTVVAGNPAKVIKTGVVVGDNGQIIDNGSALDV